MWPKRKEGEKRKKEEEEEEKFIHLCWNSVEFAGIQWSLLECRETPFSGHLAKYMQSSSTS